MKNKTIKTIVVFILCIYTIFAINHFIKKKNLYIEDLSGYPVNYIHVSTPLFDFQNKSLCVGFSDNTFVGKVMDVYYGGAYYDKYYESGDVFTPRNSRPCTRYEVLVSESIKGKLQKDEMVTVYKYAGIGTKRTLNIISGDIMPVKSEEYIFLARVNDAGMLVIVDPFGNVALTEEGYNVISSNFATERASNKDTIKEEKMSVVSTVTPDGRVVTTEVYDFNKKLDSFRHYSKNMTREEVIESYREAFRTQRNPIEELKK